MLPEITSPEVMEPVFILNRDYAGGHRSLFLPNSSKENIFLQCFLSFCESSPLEAPDKGGKWDEKLGISGKMLRGRGSQGRDVDGWRCSEQEQKEELI